MKIRNCYLLLLLLFTAGYQTAYANEPVCLSGGTGFKYKLWIKSIPRSSSESLSIKKIFDVQGVVVQTSPTRENIIVSGNAEKSSTNNSLTIQINGEEIELLQDGDTGVVEFNSKLVLNANLNGTYISLRTFLLAREAKTQVFTSQGPTKRIKCSDF